MNCERKVRFIEGLNEKLTKLMKPDRLIEALDTCDVDFVPTTASTIAKLMKQKQRRKTPSDDHPVHDIENEGYSAELGSDVRAEQYVDSHIGAIVHWTVVPDHSGQQESRV